MSLLCAACCTAAELQPRGCCARCGRVIAGAALGETPARGRAAARVIETSPSSLPFQELAQAALLQRNMCCTATETVLCLFQALAQAALVHSYARRKEQVGASRRKQEQAGASRSKQDRAGASRGKQGRAEASRIDE